VHKQLLVGRDSLFFEFGARGWVAHERGQVRLRVPLLQEFFAEGEEAGELSQIVASHGLHRVQTALVDLAVGRRPEDVDEDVDALEVLGVVEVDERRLPELLCVDGRPAQTASIDLRLPLVEGRELLVVLVEVLEELLQDFCDLLVDPGSVAQLDNQVERVDHGEVFEADCVVLQVEEDVADHAHDLFFVEKVQNLRDVLDHVQLEVLKQVQGKRVVAQDPEAAAHVVGDLSVGLALVEQQSLQALEAAVVDEVLGEFVELEQVHQTVSVGVQRKLVRLVLHVE